MDRRQFLGRASATVAASAALAGCSGLGGNDDNDGNGANGGGARAPYDDWAGTSVYGESEVQAFSVDIGALSELSDGATATPTPTATGTQQQVDPILGAPVAYLFGAGLAGLALLGFGLSHLTGEDGPMERVHSVGDVTVFEGSFDESEVTGTVEQREVESRTYQGHTVYTSGEGENASVLAVSGSALLTASAGERVSDPGAVVEDAIDAEAGSGTRYADEHGAYDDLVTALPAASILGVGFSPDGAINAATPTPTSTPSTGGESDGSLSGVSDLELDGDVRGYASSLEFSDDGEEVTARLALRYASADQVDDDETISSQAAPSGSDVSVETDGALVVVAAAYTEDSGAEL